MYEIRYPCRSPALVAQGIEHRFPKPCVAGSIPAGGTPVELLERHFLLTDDSDFRPKCRNIFIDVASVDAPGRLYPVMYADLTPILSWA